MSAKPEFLSCLNDVVLSLYGPDITKATIEEFLKELSKRLKLNPHNQVLLALSLLESSTSPRIRTDAISVLRQKLETLHSSGKPEQLPEYAIHRLLYLFDTLPEFSADFSLRDIKQHILQASMGKFSSFTPLRGVLHQDALQLNSHPEILPFNFFREGGGLDEFLDIQNLLEPWEILLDLGHSYSHSFDSLMRALSEFKNLDES
jgi:hypothetical protein